MSVEIAWKQNILVTDFHLLKSLLVVLGFGSQAFVCGFSRQNINSVLNGVYYLYTYSNQVRVVAVSLPQLTQASFLQKNQTLQNRFLISVTLRWHRVSVACKNQSF